MALGTAALKSAVKSALMLEATANETRDAYCTRVANAIATACETFVKSGTVTIPASAIATTGTSAAQTGPAAPVNLSIT